AVKITTLPASGWLTFAGNPVSPGDFVSVNSISSLVFTPALNTNDGNSSRPTFTFQVQDDGGRLNGGVDIDPIARTLTVSVTSVNDAPSGVNATVTVLEDRAFTFQPANFIFTDVNDSPSNNLAAVRISTLPSAAQGTLKLSGSPVTPGTLIPVSQINVGQLTF